MNEETTMKGTTDRHRLGRRPLLPTTIVVLASLFGLLPIASSDSRPPDIGSTPASVRAKTPPTQITAHDSKFWSGSQPITFHGAKFNFQPNDPGAEAQLDQIRSFGMNFIRGHVFWTDLEPNPPVQSGGVWTHSYDSSYIDIIKRDIAWAHEKGLYVLVSSFADQPLQYYFGWPDWLYDAPYNSKGINYPETEQGRTDSATDFWSDALRKKFMVDFLTYLAVQLAGTPGIVGYEILNEPSEGTLPPAHGTTQLIIDWQLTAAKAIRAADPPRVIFFQTRGGGGTGLPLADLTNWVNGPPGNPSGLPQPSGHPNIAFDAHDYFGARWGSGLQQSPTSPEYTEDIQDLYVSTLAGDWGTAPPYIGTTLGHVRWIQDKLTDLAPWGIPLLVGEFGVPNVDPNAALFFGTATSALNYLGVSWSVSGSNNGIVDQGTGELRPYAQIVIDAAADYP